MISIIIVVLGRYSSNPAEFDDDFSRALLALDLQLAALLVCVYFS